MPRDSGGPSDASLRDFIAAVGSAEEAHGAVSAAAAAGGLGSSLLLMVATLPQARTDSITDRTKLIEAATGLTAVQQLALRASAEVPLEVMRLCARGLELAATVAAHGARAASADVQLGVALLQAGFSGARSNLEGKLSSFTDATSVRSLVDEIGRLSDDFTTASRAADSLIMVPPA